MVKITELIERFRLHSHHPTGELVLPPARAMELIDAARAHDIAITGIEMFRVRGTSIVPDLDWIADYSAAFEPGHQPVAETSAAARAFIESLPEDPTVRVIIGLADDSA